MRAAHRVEQVRSAEAELMAGLPDGALMDRAAAGLAVAIVDFLGSCFGRRVLLLIGAGDNGGDALYAGARLARRGAAVEAVLLSKQAHAGGVAALVAAGGRVIPAADIATAHRPEVVVDGIVGIGGRPGIRPVAVAALERFAGVPVVAVDVPSGVDVDTGRLDGDHVRADLTVSFGTLKIALLVDPAAQAAGSVHLVDLGLDLPAGTVEALQADDVAALLPVPRPFDQKYSRGVVGVAAGSRRYPGAAVLCTSGANCGLAGMVRYVGEAAEEVRAAHPEIVVGPGRVQAWVVGSGSGEDAAALLTQAGAGQTAEAVERVPTVVDADAIALVERSRRRQPLVLTPHAGELAGLLQLSRTEVEADQLATVVRAAASYRCVVMLKGRHTLIAAPDGRVRVTTTGVPWLATAGAGDVLAGVTGALLAAGLDGFDAASVGSWLHGAAATYAADGGPLTAVRVAAAVAPTVAALLTA